MNWPAIPILALLLILAAPALHVSAQPNDPISVVKALETALNARDATTALALFADNALVKDGDPAPGASGNFVGKDQIRDWIAVIVDPALDFRVVSTNHQNSGAVVTWTWAVSVADLTLLGIDPETGSGAALIQDGKIVFYSVASSAEWRAKLYAVTQAPASLPKTNSDPVLNLALPAIAGACALIALGFALHRTRLRGR